MENRGLGGGELRAPGPTNRQPELESGLSEYGLLDLLRAENL